MRLFYVLVTVFFCLHACAGHGGERNEHVSMKGDMGDDPQELICEMMESQDKEEDNNTEGEDDVDEEDDEDDEDEMDEMLGMLFMGMMNGKGPMGMMNRKGPMGMMNGKGTMGMMNAKGPMGMGGMETKGETDNMNHDEDDEEDDDEEEDEEMDEMFGMLNFLSNMMKVQGPMGMMNAKGPMEMGGMETKGETDNMNHDEDDEEDDEEEEDEEMDEMLGMLYFLSNMMKVQGPMGMMNDKGSMGMMNGNGPMGMMKGKGPMGMMNTRRQQNTGNGNSLHQMIQRMRSQLSPSSGMESATMQATKNMSRGIGEIANSMSRGNTESRKPFNSTKFLEMMSKMEMIIGMATASNETKDALDMLKSLKETVTEKTNMSEVRHIIMRMHNMTSSLRNENGTDKISMVLRMIKAEFWGIEMMTLGGGNMKGPKPYDRDMNSMMSSSQNNMESTSNNNRGMKGMKSYDRKGMKGMKSYDRKGMKGMKSYDRKGMKGMKSYDRDNMKGMKSYGRYNNKRYGGGYRMFGMRNMWMMRQMMKMMQGMMSGYGSYGMKGPYMSRMKGRDRYNMKGMKSYGGQSMGRYRNMNSVDMESRKPFNSTKFLEMMSKMEMIIGMATAGNETKDVLDMLKSLKETVTEKTNMSEVRHIIMRMHNMTSSLRNENGTDEISMVLRMMKAEFWGIEMMTPGGGNMKGPKPYDRDMNSMMSSSQNNMESTSNNNRGMKGMKSYDHEGMKGMKSYDRKGMKGMKSYDRKGMKGMKSYDRKGMKGMKSYDRDNMKGMKSYGRYNNKRYGGGYRMSGMRNMWMMRQMMKMMQGMMSGYGSYGMKGPYMSRMKGRDRYNMKGMKSYGGQSMGRYRNMNSVDMESRKPFNSTKFLEMMSKMEMIIGMATAGNETKDALDMLKSLKEMVTEQTNMSEVRHIIMRMHNMTSSLRNENGTDEISMVLRMMKAEFWGIEMMTPGGGNMKGPKPYDRDMNSMMSSSQNNMESTSNNNGGMKGMKSYDRKGMKGMKSYDRKGMKGMKSYDRKGMKGMKSYDRDNTKGMKSYDRDNMKGMKSYDRDNMKGMKSYGRYNNKRYGGGYRMSGMRNMWMMRQMMKMMQGMMSGYGSYGMKGPYMSRMKGRDRYNMKGMKSYGGQSMGRYRNMNSVDMESRKPFNSTKFLEMMSKMEMIIGMATAGNETKDALDMLKSLKETVTEKTNMSEVRHIIMRMHNMTSSLRNENGTDEISMVLRMMKAEFWGIEMMTPGGGNMKGPKPYDRDMNSMMSSSQNNMENAQSQSRDNTSTNNSGDDDSDDNREETSNEDVKNFMEMMKRRLESIGEWDADDEDENDDEYDGGNDDDDDEDDDGYDDDEDDSDDEDDDDMENLLDVFEMFEMFSGSMMGRSPPMRPRKPKQKNSNRMVCRRAPRPIPLMMRSMNVSSTSTPENASAQQMSAAGAPRSSFAASASNADGRKLGEASDRSESTDEEISKSMMRKMQDSIMPMVTREVERILKEVTSVMKNSDSQFAAVFEQALDEALGKRPPPVLPISRHQLNNVAWSDCSATCGYGTQMRSIPCDQTQPSCIDGYLNEVRQCKYGNCSDSSNPCMSDGFHCGENAVCRPKPSNGYYCVCKPGYHGDGQNCEHRCPASTYGSLALEGRCFILHARNMNQTMTYDAYDAKCVQSGGQLAIIDDIKTWIDFTYWLQRIKSQSFRNMKFLNPWIGLRREVLSGVWHYDGMHVDTHFVLWDTDEPQPVSSGKNCATFNPLTGRASSQFCTALTYAVCEYKN